MASFKILTGISPYLEGFLLLKVKISLLISSNETKLKVKKFRLWVVWGLNSFNANMVMVVINDIL